MAGLGISSVVRIVASAGVGVMMACSAELPERGNGDTGEMTVPLQVGEWRGEDGWEVFDTETIFSYIDGHAEVYLAYGMRRCLSRRYAGPGAEPDIVVDLFEQASPADAFGVFTHDRDGEEVDVGQGGLYRHGWLSFWKGRWFGSVYAEGESEATRDAVVAVGRAAAAAIADVGEVPPLVSELPEAGLEGRSVRFLHTQEILNGLVYLGYDNALLLGPEVDAVMGRYLRPGGSGWLLLVDYPDPGHAERAEAGAEASGIAVRRRSSRLAAVLAPESPAVAAGLLDDAMGGE